MYFAIDCRKIWRIPAVIRSTTERMKEMEHMGAAYTEDIIDDVLSRCDRVFTNVAIKER